MLISFCKAFLSPTKFCISNKCEEANGVSSSSLPLSEEPSTDRQTDTRSVPCFGVATSLWQTHQEVSVRHCRKSSFSGLSLRWLFTYATFQRRLTHNMHCSFTDYQNTNATQGMKRAEGGMWVNC